MSYPSGQLLMQQLIADESLPVGTRLQAIREPSYRPTLSFLLRLIDDQHTPAKLRAAAVIRYNQLLALLEVTRHARRNEKTTTTQAAIDDAAPQPN